MKQETITIAVALVLLMSFRYAATCVWNELPLIFASLLW